MELNKIDFNKLAVFCAVVDAGNNYQRASEVLNVSPSALSQTISGLENSIGFQLFDRLGKRLVPTARGLRIHKEFRASQANLSRALADLKEPQTKVGGLLRIGSYFEFAKAQLSPVLSSFTKEFPDTQIKIVFDTPSRLQSLLAQDQLDLCFSIFPAQDLSGTKMISSESVCQEELVLIAKRNTFSEAPSYEEILQTPIVEYYFNHQPICRWLKLHYKKRPKKVPARIYASTAEMVLSLVTEGAGIGIVPAYLVTGGSHDPGIQIVRPTRKQLNDYIWLLERAHAEKPAIHRVFKARILKTLSPSV